MADSLIEICKHTGKPIDCKNCQGDGTPSRADCGTHRVHLSQSVTGPLRMWNKKKWREATEFMTKKDGGRFTAEGLKEEFQSLADKGVEVIPYGECDNFCFKKGCRGHAVLDGVVNP